MLAGMNDQFEYWIWEHAMKFGFAKVLKSLKSKYIQINIPDCWVTALFYQEVKEKLEKDVMLSCEDLEPREFNSIHDTLLTLLKQHGKELSQIMKRIDLLTLQLYSKAIFILMKSSNSEPLVRRQAIEKLFPMWSQEYWLKTKKSHSLKENLREDFRHTYEEIRANLSKDNPQQMALKRFIGLMQKHFPTLITFLRKIKRSTLEKIQIKSINLHPSLHFVRSLLENGVEDEMSILHVLEEYQRQRLRQIGKKILNQRIKLCGKSGGDAWRTAVYALPPVAVPGSNVSNEEPYPDCFETNPSMPTSYLARDVNGRSVKEVFTNKATPRDSNGKFFQPHWFSEGSAISIKQENIETIQETSSSQVNLPNSVKDGSSAVTTNEGLNPRTSVESMSIKSTHQNDKDGSRNIKLDQPLNGEPNRVQQWINTQPSSSSSDSERELFVFHNKNEKFCTVDQTTLRRVTLKRSYIPTSNLVDGNQIRGGVENQTSNGQPSESSQNKDTPNKHSSSRSVSVSSKRKERSLIDISDTKEASKICETSVLTRAQKRAQSALSCSSFQKGSENSISPRRRTPKRSLLVSQPIHSNRKKLSETKESTSIRKTSGQKKIHSKSTTQSSTEDSDSDINPPSSKKKNNRISSSDSEDGVRIPCISTPAPSESPSSYATPEQGIINPNGTVQMSKLPTQEKNTTKRRLYKDEDEVVSKSSKRAPVLDGSRKLSDLVVVLHSHYGQLRLKSEEEVQHAEKLNSCLERISNLKKA